MLPKFVQIGKSYPCPLTAACLQAAVLLAHGQLRERGWSSERTLQVGAKCIFLLSTSSVAIAVQRDIEAEHRDDATVKKTKGAGRRKRGDYCTVSERGQIGNGDVVQRSPEEDTITKASLGLVRTAPNATTKERPDRWRPRCQRACSLARYEAMRMNTGVRDFRQSDESVIYSAAVTPYLCSRRIPYRPSGSEAEESRCVQTRTKHHRRGAG